MYNVPVISHDGEDYRKLEAPHRAGLSDGLVAAKYTSDDYNWNSTFGLRVSYTYNDMNLTSASCRESVHDRQQDVIGSEEIRECHGPRALT